MGDLDHRLQALLDKNEITDAVHRFARGTDRLDKASWASPETDPPVSAHFGPA